MLEAEALYDGPPFQTPLGDPSLLGLLTREAFLRKLGPWPPHSKRNLHRSTYCLVVFLRSVSAVAQYNLSPGPAR